MQYLENYSTLFHQTLVIGVLKAKDKLVKSRSQQSHMRKIWEPLSPKWLEVSQ